jgi:hypothetical protein
MNEVPLTELGVLAGGGLLGFAGTVFGKLIQSQADNTRMAHERELARFAHTEQSFGAADKRQGTTLGAWTRTVLALLLVSTVTLGLIGLAVGGVPIIERVDRDPFFNLFGLIKLGGGAAYQEMRGFPLTSDLWLLVLTIVGFYFGRLAGKGK